MAELTAEQFETLPEFVRGDYQLDGEVYRPVAEFKAKALKESLNNLDGKYKGLESKFAEIEAAKAAEIEAARAKALEEAKSKGDVKAVEERYQQQMADLEKRTAERVKAETLKEFRAEQAKDKAVSIADTIGAQLGVDEDAGQLIAQLIRSRVQIDPETGKEIYHDSKGSALSVDKAGFIAELKSEGAMKRLIKGDVPASGGGMAQGGGFGKPSATGKPYSEMTLAEKTAYNAKRRG